MSKPFVNKTIPPACQYCAHGIASKFTDEVFCSKKGVTKKNDYCRKYKYDILKRTPNTIHAKTDFTKEDFEI